MGFEGGGLGLRLGPTAVRLHRHGRGFPLGDHCTTEEAGREPKFLNFHRPESFHMLTPLITTLRNYYPWSTDAETKPERNTITGLRSQSHDHLNSQVYLPLSA